MSYSLLNLDAVEDVAPAHGLGETQEARFPRAQIGAEQTGFAYLVIKPNRREAFAHRHTAAEEIYVILAGSGTVKLDDDIVNLAPLDAVRVSPPTTRCFEAGDEGLAILIFGPHTEADGEIVPDFWDT